MKSDIKNPPKIKELLCVLFGHNWDEYGEKKCLKHNTVYDKHNTCSRCGLEKHTKPNYCQLCFDKTIEKIFGKKL